MATRVNIEAAERFMLGDARLLDRHRLAVMLHGASVTPVVDALRAYRNVDGGFGHALEPDVRAPESEPTSTLQALEVLAEIDALDDPALVGDMLADAAAWIATIANADGGVPFVLPTAAAHPHAPWMEPSAEGSHLTFAIAARLTEARVTDPWVAHATQWCWNKLENVDALGGYWVKFALNFLDSVPDEERARAAIETFRSRLSGDGSLPVEGGTADERITPVAMSPRPGLRSRALFTQDQIDADLDALERRQQDDGGWTFDWLAWSPGQTVEWRGTVTLQALETLRAHELI
jgi:hypothetical protein